MVIGTLQQRGYRDDPAWTITLHVTRFRAPFSWHLFSQVTWANGTMRAKGRIIEATFIRIIDTSISESFGVISRLILIHELLVANHLDNYSALFLSREFSQTAAIFSLLVVHFFYVSMSFS